ncbi:MAG: hypothetical protein KGJ11_00255 [Candidatus Omnitrophica bacterium]|nr:hypothetical protein [Candidatus Omnitrophota bacterium]
MIFDVKLEVQESAQELESMSFDINSKWVFDPTQGALNFMPYPWGQGSKEETKAGTNDN